MSKRSKNGMVDPYATKRVGASTRIGFRQATIPLARGKTPGFKDDAQTSKDLAAINREYRDKEFAVASSNGPHSTPEQHYPKSFFITPKKEEEDA